MNTQQIGVITVMIMLEVVIHKATTMTSEGLYSQRMKYGTTSDWMWVERPERSHSGQQPLLNPGGLTEFLFLLYLLLPKFLTLPQN